MTAPTTQTMGGTGSSAVPSAGLAAHQVSLSFGRQSVLDRVDLHLAPGETVGLRGPSGSGKSTLARVLGLLHTPDAGHVTFDGRPVVGARHRLPAAIRTRVAILFQSPRAATDPRLSLADIVAEPLRATGTGKDEARAQAAELAELVGLTPDLLTRRPHAVSDGQLQRACLARALVHRPAYLLCDEATAMLDASTQAHLAGVITDYQRQHHAAVLLITHDPALMTRWATRVVDLPPPAGS
ncbi:ABC transporter ATP-binding protein [Micromonospora sp. ATCC 39149]|uniref:ABC transporter ATP-binding protein n=1 Tax=Micromonospora carbonacea TaxID=47853 RepID=A0A7D6CDM4_9ACTN|nr:dipeptide/oligopeptide/nickel ABC transporter ATP-binding protein [Micromonospora sp. ATCC 39149]EEP72226.1 ABC transporter ATP-binding protein [Micromonospora sp. ATCC 39149]QLJ98410.1 ABC transporter ATP-binding protein [Micromonospora carbonacea]